MAVLLAVVAITLAQPADYQEGLKQFYQEKNSAKRDMLMRGLIGDVIKPGSEERKAAAIRQVNFWEPQPPGIQDLKLHIGRGERADKHVFVNIPADYEHSRAWPMVVTLHGQGQPAQSMMAMTRAILGTAADSHIIVAPQDLGPIGLTEPEKVVDQPRRLLRELRRSFHIDSDRVFLMGYSIGGHNTWMAGIMNADCFAGIMPLATPLQVIGNDMLYDVFTPNLGNLNTLFVWGAKDNLGQDGHPHPQGGNAAMSRVLADVMRKSCADRFTGVELPNAAHGNVTPPSDKVAAWLKQKRKTWPTSVTQRFRLPGQSRAAWIRAVELMGKPLADAASTVKLKPGENTATAQKRHLVAQLGLIEASVDKQTILITTRKVKDVELLLSDELIDLDKPIKVIRNKREVFDGRVYRSVGTMLQETAETLDFARIPQTRLVIPASGRKVTGDAKETN